MPHKVAVYQICSGTLKTLHLGVNFYESVLSVRDSNIQCVLVVTQPEVRSMSESTLKRDNCHVRSPI